MTSAVTNTSAGVATAASSYCYDADGNLTTAPTNIGVTCPGIATYTYDGADQVLSQPFGSHASYDADGNETLIDSSAASGTSQTRATTILNTDQADGVSIAGGGTADQDYAIGGRLCNGLVEIRIPR